MLTPTGTPHAESIILFVYAVLIFGSSYSGIHLQLGSPSLAGISVFTFSTVLGLNAPGQFWGS